MSGKFISDEELHSLIIDASRTMTILTSGVFFYKMKITDFTDDCVVVKCEKGIIHIFPWDRIDCMADTD